MQKTAAEYVFPLEVFARGTLSNMEASTGIPVAEEMVQPIVLAG